MLITQDAKPIEGQGLSTDCWPHVHLSVDTEERRPVSIGVTCHHIEPFNRCWPLEIKITSSHR